MLLACAFAVWLAARATPSLQWERVPVGAALGAIAAWALVSAAGPSIAGDDFTPLSHGETTLSIIAAGAIAAALTLLALHYRERRAPSAPAQPVPVAALGESS